MILRFIKNVGRFTIGMVRDYPKSTWEGIAKAAKMPLSSFTEEVMTDDIGTIVEDSNNVRNSSSRNPPWTAKNKNK